MVLKILIRRDKTSFSENILMHFGNILTFKEYVTKSHLFD